MDSRSDSKHINKLKNDLKVTSLPESVSIVI